jgi:NAD-dependent DNA ligase
MSNQTAVAQVVSNRALTRATQVLMGIVTGIVADGQLQDTEVLMLNTWLTENAEVTSVWPGSAIAHMLRTVLADGVITHDEREHMLTELQSLAGTDFSATGSSSSNVVGLPYDHGTSIIIPGSAICHTGVFLFGTRAACEKLTEKAGGTALQAVTRKAKYLVVGTHVSPAWVGTSYGRKIQQAMELKQAGHPISIIAEEWWLNACCN